MIRLIGAILLVLAGTSQAAAQVPSLESLIPAGDATAAGRIIQLILVVTVLSVAPGLLIMVTCFTRFVVARQALQLGADLRGAQPARNGQGHALADRPIEAVGAETVEPRDRDERRIERRRQIFERQTRQRTRQAFEHCMEEAAKQSVERWRLKLVGNLNALVKNLGEPF